MITHTHTFATLEVPHSLYAFIRSKLKNAGYDENISTVVGDTGEQEILTMQGIALTCERRSEKPKETSVWRPLFPPQERTLEMVELEHRLTEIEATVKVMQEFYDLKERLARIKVLIETPLTGPFRAQIYVLAGGDPNTLPNDG